MSEDTNLKQRNVVHLRKYFETVFFLLVCTSNQKSASKVHLCHNATASPQFWDLRIPRLSLIQHWRHSQRELSDHELFHSFCLVQVPLQKLQVDTDDLIIVCRNGDGSQTVAENKGRESINTRGPDFVQHLAVLMLYVLLLQ